MRAAESQIGVESPSRWRGRAQGVTWQLVVLEVIEVDPSKSKRPGWVWAESMVARLPPTIREAGTPRWAHVETSTEGSGPEQVPDAAHRPSQRCPAGDLHRSIQRGV